MAVLWYLSFFLGCSRRLPSIACCSSLLGSGLAENKIVFGDVSKPFGLFSFVLGHFFLLGVGLGLSMKWARVIKFFVPTITPSKSCCPAPQTERRILVSSGLYHGLSSLVLHRCQSLFICLRHIPGASVYGARPY